MGEQGGNLPAGVNLSAEGNRGSDDLFQGEKPRKRGDADGLHSSEVMGERGRVGEGEMEPSLGERCGTCKKGTEVKNKKTGHEYGAVICAQGKRWQWLPMRLPCQFSPSRYERRTDQQ